jgi:hypothetical protein
VALGLDRADEAAWVLWGRHPAKKYRDSSASLGMTYGWGYGVGVPRGNTGILIRLRSGQALGFARNDVFGGVVFAQGSKRNRWA